jgi:hypothetical protein
MLIDNTILPGTYNRESSGHEPCEAYYDRLYEEAQFFK